MSVERPRLETQMSLERPRLETQMSLERRTQMTTENEGKNGDAPPACCCGSCDCGFEACGASGILVFIRYTVLPLNINPSPRSIAGFLKELLAF